MNLIPQIAKILGMELDEEFKVKTPANIEKRCRFHEAGNGVVYLEKYSEVYGQWTQENAEEIGRIVVGNYKVEKQPFKPKDGETYYTVQFYRDNFKALKVTTCDTTWHGDFSDYERKYYGNVFRTKAEAEFHKYEIYQKLTGN